MSCACVRVMLIAGSRHRVGAAEDQASPKPDDSAACECPIPWLIARELLDAECCLISFCSCCRRHPSSDCEGLTLSTSALPLADTCQPPSRGRS